jgi:hypothetical protein
VWEFPFSPLLTAEIFAQLLKRSGKRTWRPERVVCLLDGRGTIISGRRLDTGVAAPWSVAAFLEAGAAVRLSAVFCYPTGEVLGAWGNARKCQQGSGVRDAVGIVGSGVQFKFGLAGKMAFALQGSLLYRILRGESSDISRARFLKRLRKGDGCSAPRKE